jgi:hypothetical protein
MIDWMVRPSLMFELILTAEIFEKALEYRG